MLEKIVFSRKKSKMFESKILSIVAFDLISENEFLHKKSLKMYFWNSKKKFNWKVQVKAAAYIILGICDLCFQKIWRECSIHENFW